MFYRFSTGSDQGTNSMLGFTLHANNQAEAIGIAQKVVDSIKQINMKDVFPGDLGAKTIGDIDVQDLSIYAGVDAKITAENIEDEWTDEENLRGCQ